MSVVEKFLARTIMPAKERAGHALKTTSSSLSAERLKWDFLFGTGFSACFKEKTKEIGKQPLTFRYSPLPVVHFTFLLDGSGHDSAFPSLPSGWQLVR
jgi:hypothetical protein